MSTPLEDAYFDWLYAKVALLGPQDKSYFELVRILHNTEFVWLILGDDNRGSDGEDLRYLFLRSELIEEEDASWPMINCSVLEMLIAFAIKAEFQTDDSVRDWFWEFMDNLHLTEFSDDNMSYEAVDEILYTFVWRLYDLDGSGGGLFPLRSPSKDQRKVEIWYQFSEYILENDRLA